MHATEGHHGREFSLINEWFLFPHYFSFPQQLKVNETEARKVLYVLSVLIHTSKCDR